MRKEVDKLQHFVDVGLKEIAFNVEAAFRVQTGATLMAKQCRNNCACFMFRRWLSTFRDFFFNSRSERTTVRIWQVPIPFGSNKKMLSIHRNQL